MGAYVIHFDLDSFIQQADTTGVGDEPIYAVSLLETHSTHGVETGVTSAIIATYRDFGGSVHACRIVVEWAETLTERDAILARVRERATTALDALVARLPGQTQRPAVQLVPGLYEDLKRFQAVHDLWTWEDRKDPLRRQLVSRSAPPA